MDRVYVVEWMGCECGGVENEAAAFATREQAEEWIRRQGRYYPIPVDSYEVVELEVRV